MLLHFPLSEILLLLYNPKTNIHFHYPSPYFKWLTMSNLWSLAVKTTFINLNWFLTPTFAILFSKFSCLHFSNDFEPSCHSEAVKHPYWLEAMNKDFIVLLSNGTWILVLEPYTTNIIGCKWVYKIKRKTDGTIDKYKTRLVAKEFHQ